MKHSILALPALFRLACASQNTFSVHDDLLAFPQYEVTFAEDFFTEAQAQSRLRRSNNNNDAINSDEAAPPSQVEHYRGADDRANRETGSYDDEEAEMKVEYEYMMLDSQPYLCSIPQVAKAKAAEKSSSSSTNDTLSKAEEAKEVSRATERGWELLSGMQGTCVYFISGWWSYQYCYHEGVRQFHQLPPGKGVPIYPPVEDPGVESYTLGLYKGDQGEKEGAVGKVEKGKKDGGKGKKGKTDGGKVETGRNDGGGDRDGQLVQRGESRYLVQKLDGGTKCDLTDKPRRVEVQFHCNQHPSDRISLIKESSTCAYLMVIQTPRLCNDVAFLPPQKDAANSISCSPILAEEQVEDYKNDLASLHASFSEGAQTGIGSGEAAVQMVGDIPVAAHRLVPPSLKLEKGAILGGGGKSQQQEEGKYIATVASSSGKVEMSAEDIAKLGLGDVKAVEKLKRRLEEIAKGEEWKLDVVGTAKGREYRGIIGAKEEQDGKEEVRPDDEQGEDGKRGEEGSKEEYFREEL